jgi:CubicO group peptidase (beta-lactamase class C family)
MGGPWGYGYQWWIEPGEDGAFEAIGIYGQSIYVDPKLHVVIVQASAWPIRRVEDLTSTKRVASFTP